MSQIKILIADPNEFYLDGIALEFLKKERDRVDLHGITESAFWEEFCAAPEDCDIALINERMAGKEVFGYGFRYIFILRETIDGSGLSIPSKENIKVIHKWVSASEIYDQVVKGCPFREILEEREREEAERLRREAEERARAEAEERAREEAEERARAKEERARRKEEERARAEEDRVRREAEERARAEAEAKARAEADKVRREAEKASAETERLRSELERARREAEEKVRKEAARIRREAEEKASAEVEKLRSELERARREAEEKVRAEADKARREAEEKVRGEAERARREAEEKASAEAERLRSELDRVRQEAERLRREADERLHHEEAERLRREAEEKSRAGAERLLRENAERMLAAKEERAASMRGSKRGPEVILMHGSCGGAGKTAVALGLAYCMTRMRQRVLYVDAEYMQDFQVYMRSRKALSRDALACLSSNPENIYEKMKSFLFREGFAYLPASPRYLQLYNVGMDAYFNLIRGAKASGEYDYIIVDTDSAFGNVKATLFSIADRAVIVSRAGQEGDARLGVLHGILDSESNTGQVIYARNFAEDPLSGTSENASGSGSKNILLKKDGHQRTAGREKQGDSIVIEKAAEPKSLEDLGKIRGIRELAVRIVTLPEVPA